jgi:pyruvate dehydrogenase E2 component (dihydrolipoamide acetyltransferase)
VQGAGYTDIPHSRFRRAVAGALTASKQQVPHFYLKATCRVDSLLDLRRQVNAESGVRITINDFVVKAAARALVEVPDMNVVWTPDAVRRFDHVDIAVAVDSERGLMTPVVRAAQSRSLSDLSATIKDLAGRASAGSLKQQELEGGSLAISNLGMFGIEEFAAIINPPQAGILAVGAITSRPVQQDDGGVGFGQFLTVVLSADHRAVDGALAARWLSTFRELVENPMRLLV